LGLVPRPRGGFEKTMHEIEKAWYGKRLATWGGREFVRLRFNFVIRGPISCVT
jgi:hypothetical protein